MIQLTRLVAKERPPDLGSYSQLRKMIIDLKSATSKYLLNKVLSKLTKILIVDTKRHTTPTTNNI